MATIAASAWESLGLSIKQVKDARMNDKHLLVVYNYLTNGLNKSKAYRDAGYTTKSPNVDANALLAKPHIRKLLTIATDYLIEPLKDEVFWGIVDKARVIVLANLADYVDPKTYNFLSIEELQKRGIDTRPIKNAIPTAHGYKIELYDYKEGADVLKTYIDIAQGYDNRVKIVDRTAADMTDEELEKQAAGEL